MATVIDLPNGEREIIFNESDFARLVEIHMGWEAADYLNEILNELDRYREEDPDYDQ